MPSKLINVELHGLDGFLVEIEVDKRLGKPVFTIVGLPDAAVQEAKERVTSAVRNSDFEFPRSKVIVNLAPADLKKFGPRYDLSIALGIIVMMKQLSAKALKDTIAIGELALDGTLRPINGMLASVEFAIKQGFKKIILPKENAKEAALIPGIKIMPAGNLNEAVLYLKEKLEPLPIKPTDMGNKRQINVDMSMIKGQAQAKRALEIAAAGGHNILLCGAPGAGKTLMAKAFSGILPSMSLDEKLEVSKIYSVAGMLSKNAPLINERPFRSVHHTASAMSIVGGGNMPGPGEISLSHRGVLFMDEIAEFPKAVLEVLRQPLEDQVVTVSRVRGSCTYPCKFTLIAAMNPCPCGYNNVENAKQECTCSAIDIQRYEKRLSGPLLDRIDMYVYVNPVDFAELTSHSVQENSETVRARVEQANQTQLKRFSGTKIKSNSEMSTTEMEKFCTVDGDAKKLLSSAMQQMNISARGYSRVLKLARTIADLDGKNHIQSCHIAEALQYKIGLTSKV